MAFIPGKEISGNVNVILTMTASENFHLVFGKTAWFQSRPRLTFIFHRTLCEEIIGKREKGTEVEAVTAREILEKIAEQDLTQLYNGRPTKKS